MGWKQCYLMVSALVWHLGSSGLFWLLQMGSVDDNCPKCWSSVFYLLHLPNEESKTNELMKCAA